MSMKIGIFIDASNLSMNGGSGMRYDILTQLASQGTDVPQRLNAYIAYDVERANTDQVYKQNSKMYHSKLRGCGFKVCITEVKTYHNVDGTKTKSNADMDLAIDLLIQSERLDRVILGSGDGDFVRVVSALQDKGLRVDILGFKNISRKLVECADGFLNGSLIPNLILTPYLNANLDVTTAQLSDYKQMTGLVTEIDYQMELVTIRYLKQIPASFLDHDNAWETISLPYTKEEYGQGIIRRNQIVSWVAYSERNLQRAESFPIVKVR